MTALADPPADMQGTPITPGTVLYFPTATGGAGNGPAIRHGTVTAIEPPSHRGYGYWTCRLKVRRTDNNTLATVPYPTNCLVDPTASPAPAELKPPLAAR